MRYIVDTHILLWTLLDSKKLSANIQQVYKNADEVQASNISFWEIALKYRLGKLDLQGVTPLDILAAAKESNFKIIDVDAKTMASFHKLPLRNHKDPFDRILIWYAIQEKVTLISRDSLFGEYIDDGLNIIKPK